MSAVPPHEVERYVGLMSGTSLDGIDAVLAEIDPGGNVRLLKSHYQPYPDALRAKLLRLHAPQADELHLTALAANELARLYAAAVHALLGDTDPDAGYTLQIGNAALLAELTGASVIADFRSRDVAAGGQGAPLVPAFHARVLAHPGIHRVIANIGGIANVTDLPADGGRIRGWDTGPGNLLLDAWIARHQGTRYDRGGAWGAQGTVDAGLLQALRAHDFFAMPPPKSAGREQFNLAWLDAQLTGLGRAVAPVDVQATLLEFTAVSLADAVRRECGGAGELYVCGGGAHNDPLMRRLAALLPGVRVDTTAALGIDPDWVEALAFAWLARQTLHRAPGNLPTVTGARGPRILGAIYPA